MAGVLRAFPHLSSEGPTYLESVMEAIPIGLLSGLGPCWMLGFCQLVSKPHQMGALERHPRGEAFACWMWLCTPPFQSPLPPNHAPGLPWASPERCGAAHLMNVALSGHQQNLPGGELSLIPFPSYLSLTPLAWGWGMEGTFSHTPGPAFSATLASAKFLKLLCNPVSSTGTLPSKVRIPGLGLFSSPRGGSGPFPC